MVLSATQNAIRWLNVTGLPQPHPSLQLDTFQNGDGFFELGQAV